MRAGPGLSRPWVSPGSPAVAWDTPRQHRLYSCPSGRPASGSQVAQLGPPARSCGRLQPPQCLPLSRVGGSPSRSSTGSLLPGYLRQMAGAVPAWNSCSLNSHRLPPPMPLRQPVLPRGSPLPTLPPGTLQAVCGPTPHSGRRGQKELSTEPHGAAAPRGSAGEHGVVCHR